MLKTFVAIIFCVLLTILLPTSLLFGLNENRCPAKPMLPIWLVYTSGYAAVRGLILWCFAIFGEYKNGLITYCKVMMYFSDIPFLVLGASTFFKNIPQFTNSNEIDDYCQPTIFFCALCVMYTLATFLLYWFYHLYKTVYHDELPSSNCIFNELFEPYEIFVYGNQFTYLCLLVKAYLYVKPSKNFTDQDIKEKKEIPVQSEPKIKKLLKKLHEIVKK